jgi:hypothetical protein
LKRSRESVVSGMCIHKEPTDTRNAPCFKCLNYCSWPLRAIAAAAVVVQAVDGKADCGYEEVKGKPWSRTSEAVRFWKEQ